AVGVDTAVGIVDVADQDIGDVGSDHDLHRIVDVHHHRHAPRGAPGRGEGSRAPLRPVRPVWPKHPPVFPGGTPPFRPASSSAGRVAPIAPSGGDIWNRQISLRPPAPSAAPPSVRSHPSDGCLSSASSLRSIGYARLLHDNRTAPGGCRYDDITRSAYEC